MNLSQYKSRDLVPLICSKCGTTFHRPKNQVQALLKKYKYTICNKNCKVTHLDKVCLCCGKSYKFNNNHSKFCGHSCAATYNNTRKPKTEKEKIKPAKKIDLSGWKAGDNFSSIDSKTIKKYLIEHLQSSACQDCGWDKYHTLTGNNLTQLHHIDGDSLNNRLINLRLLCPNCHSMTENYGFIGRKKSTRPAYVAKRKS